MRIAMMGNGRSVHAIARAGAVARRGHLVRLVTVGHVLRTAETVEVCTREMPRAPWQAVAAARGVLADLRSFQADVLHLHYAGGRLGTLAALSSVRPLVVTVMGGDVLEDQHPGGRMSPVDRRTTRRVLEEAAVILVKSDALRPAVDALGDFTTKVRTVRWGVDPAVFRRDVGAARALRARLSVADGDRVVVSPRILQPQYNVHLLVEAMPRILQVVPHALLVVTEYQAGESYRRRLVEAASAGGCLDRVRFVGRLEHADMPALYSLAEVAVSVPASDGLPQSLFEALACETPVVLGRLDAYREVVQDGESALLVERDPASIAGAVLRLLGDPALSAGLAARGRAAVAAAADLTREAERVEGFYREAMAAPGLRAGPLARAVDLLGLGLRGMAP